MTFSQKAERMLEIPDGTLSGTASLLIDGRTAVTVNGSCDILEYEDSMMRLKTESGEIRVSGDRLVLRCLHTAGASITGRLLSIEFM